MFYWLCKHYSTAQHLQFEFQTGVSIAFVGAVGRHVCRVHSFCGCSPSKCVWVSLPTDHFISEQIYSFYKQTHTNTHALHFAFALVVLACVCPQFNPLLVATVFRMCARARAHTHFHLIRAMFIDVAVVGPFYPSPPPFAFVIFDSFSCIAKYLDCIQSTICHILVALRSSSYIAERMGGWVFVRAFEHVCVCV